jgi:DNA-binding response OmpR family regulator
VTAPLLVIADDDRDMRALVRDWLRPEFPDALEVADGRDLFWQLLRASFGIGIGDRELVIVADIRMPAYSGLDVLDAWCDAGQPVPIVVITAFPDEWVRHRVARLDAQLLAKPFSRGQLREAVRAAASRARGRTCEVSP